jgi:hypothetical protein
MYDTAKVNLRVPMVIFANLSALFTLGVHAQTTIKATDSTQPSAKKFSSLVTMSGTTVQATSDNLLVNGKVIPHGTPLNADSLSFGLNAAFIVTDGTGCRVLGPDSVPGGLQKDDAKATKLPLQPAIDNRISVPEMKFVDQTWLKQKMNQTTQALANLNLWSGPQITASYGSVQGSTTTNTNLSAQAAPTPAASSTTTPSAVPTAPAAPSTPASPTPVLAPLDALTRQVELNAELLTYEAALNGFASDNLVIGSDGKISGTRRQVSMAFPISVNAYGPYNGAVAEVRIVLVPHTDSLGHLSVVNLLPDSRTYDVAKITTDTKQFGAGVTLDAVTLGVTSGKQKTAMYLAKDTDTIALQYPNPSAKADPDSKRQFGRGFRNLLPTGECLSTGVNWKDMKTLVGYDPDRAIVFGWQFRPVLNDDNVRPGPRTVIAQLALDGGQGGAPIAFVETRWRSYDRKRGIVGDIYRDSCTWNFLSDTAALTYDPTILNVETEDLGSGTMRVKAHGFFPDPNIQVRIGGTQRAPDVISPDDTDLEVIAPASTLANAPNVDLIGSYGQVWHLVVPAAAGKKCALDSFTAREFPGSDGTAEVNLDLTYGADRAIDDIHSPVLLIGSTAYGLRDNPFQGWKTASVSGVPHGYVELTAKTDDLKQLPSLVVRDLEWTPKQVTAPIVKDPTFLTVATAGATTNADPKTLATGWYSVTGTNFEQVSLADCATKGSPCMQLLNSTDPGNNINLDKAHIHVANASSLFVKLDTATPAPLTIVWNDGRGLSTWSLTPKNSSADKKVAADPAQLQKGDSRVVHFTGVDFSKTSGVKFEDTDLSVISKDKDSQGISVLVPTKVTGTAGTKQMLAVQAGGGDPILLTVTVVVP